MELKLRKLQATDLFTMVKILNKVGIRQIKDAIDLNEINEVRKKLAESGRKSPIKTSISDIKLLSSTFIDIIMYLSDEMIHLINTQEVSNA